MVLSKSVICGFVCLSLVFSACVEAANPGVGAHAPFVGGARSRSSAQSQRNSRASASSNSRGGEAVASASSKVAKVQFANTAVSRAISKAVAGAQDGRPIQAMADAAAEAIGDSVALVIVETKALAGVKGIGKAAAHAEGQDAAIADLFVTAVAQAFAKATKLYAKADADALADATHRAVSFALAKAKASATAVNGGLAKAKSTAIAGAAVQVLARAFANALAQIFGGTHTDANSKSNLDVRGGKIAETNSETQSAGNANALADGDAISGIIPLPTPPHPPVGGKGVDPRVNPIVGGQQHFDPRLRPQVIGRQQHFDPRLGPQVIGGQQHFDPRLGPQVIGGQHFDPRLGPLGGRFGVPHVLGPFQHGRVPPHLQHLFPNRGFFPVGHNQVPVHSLQGTRATLSPPYAPKFHKRLG